MWSAALGVVAGSLGPPLAQNLFGLRAPGPEALPWPEPLEGELRIDRLRSYGRDHPRQRFDLILPPDPLGGPFPGVVLFHGGGFARGARWYVGGIARALAYRGFAVLNADYRLLPRASLSTIVGDAVAATRYAYAHAAELEIDPHRLSTMGRSAGGHLALMAAYTAGVPVRSVVSEAGPTDLDSRDVGRLGAGGYDASVHRRRRLSDAEPRPGRAPVFAADAPAARLS